MVQFFPASKVNPYPCKIRSAAAAVCSTTGLLSHGKCLAFPGSNRSLIFGLYLIFFNFEFFNELLFEYSNFSFSTSYMYTVG